MLKNQKTCVRFRSNDDDDDDKRIHDKRPILRDCFAEALNVQWRMFVHIGKEFFLQYSFHLHSLPQNLKALLYGGAVIGGNEIYC